MRCLQPPPSFLLRLFSTAGTDFSTTAATASTTSATSLEPARREVEEGGRLRGQVGVFGRPPVLHEGASGVATLHANAAAISAI